jgi:transcriptional regulator with XRE-family HTH domain
MEKRKHILTLTVLRQKVGLTQMDLALAISSSQTHVSHWESGSVIPLAKAEAMLAILRIKDRSALPAGLKPSDLARSWDDVLLELASSSSARVARAAKRPRLRAPAGRAARHVTV